MDKDRKKHLSERTETVQKQLERHQVRKKDETGEKDRRVNIGWKKEKRKNMSHRLEQKRRWERNKYKRDVKKM